MAKRRGMGDEGLHRIREMMEQVGTDLRPAPPEDPTTFVKQKGADIYIPSGHDIGPYFVGKAEQYYQGPQLSTRVAAHSFIPVDDQGVPFVVKNKGMTDNYQPTTGEFTVSNAKYGNTPISDYEHGPYGYVFVRFQRPRTLYVYGTTEFIPMSVYRVFREYYSKGRAVTHMLEAYGYQNTDGFPYGAGVAGI